MAKFKVLETIEQVSYVEKKKRRGKFGWVWVEQEVTECISPGAYGHEDIKVGDILEINGHLADKARRNPMFEEVKEVSKKKTKKKASKKIDGDQD